MIDTGANVAVISSHLSKFLNLEPKNEFVSIKHVGDKSLSSNKICFATLNFKKFQLENVKLVICDNVSSQLILPGNIFKSVNITYSVDNRPFEIELNGFKFSAITSSIKNIHATSDFKVPGESFKCYKLNQFDIPNGIEVFCESFH